MMMPYNYNSDYYDMNKTETFTKKNYFLKNLLEENILLLRLHVLPGLGRRLLLLFPANG